MYITNILCEAYFKILPIEKKLKKYHVLLIKKKYSCTQWKKEFYLILIICLCKWSVSNFSDNPTFLDMRKFQRKYGLMFSYCKMLFAYLRTLFSLNIIIENWIEKYFHFLKKHILTVFKKKSLNTFQWFP